MHRSNPIKFKREIAIFVSLCMADFISLIECHEHIAMLLTQLTTGGKRDAEIATPINGPAAPSNNANATPVPDVNALCIK